MKSTKQTSPNNLTRLRRPLLEKGEGDTFFSFSFFKEKVGMRSLFLVLILLTACTGCDDGKLKPGEFEDPAFKACVEENINYDISIGLLNKDDPELYNKIHSLACEGGGVSSLKGIENMPNIDWLGIVDNQLESLEPLRTLTKLEWLKLNNNKIKDLEPLSGLMELNALYLVGNYIEDISPLCPLTKLTMIALSANCVTDVNQFRDLEKCISGYSSGGAENYQDPEKCQ